MGPSFLTRRPHRPVSQALARGSGATVSLVPEQVLFGPPQPAARCPVWQAGHQETPNVLGQRCQRRPSQCDCPSGKAGSLLRLRSRGQGWGAPGPKVGQEAWDWPGHLASTGVTSSGVQNWGDSGFRALPRGSSHQAVVKGKWEIRIGRDRAPAAPLSWLARCPRSRGLRVRFPVWAPTLG